MDGKEAAELYFIAGMMALILLGSGVAVFLFVRTYRREMSEKETRLHAKHAPKDTKPEDASTNVTP